MGLSTRRVLEQQSTLRHIKVLKDYTTAIDNQDCYLLFYLKADEVTNGVTCVQQRCQRAKAENQHVEGSVKHGACGVGHLHIDCLPSCRLFVEILSVRCHYDQSCEDSHP